MKHMKSCTFALAVLLSGCATLPSGPSVSVLPAQGKPFEVFQEEDAKCRSWAEARMGAPSRETVENNTAQGAVAGTALGAGIGALLGAGSGHAGMGAIFGAASGLLVGTAAGSGSGEVYQGQAQRRYDNAYVQCMYSYGNQIPGYRPATWKTAAPPPPPAVAPAPPETETEPPEAAMEERRY